MKKEILLREIEICYSLKEQLKKTIDNFQEVIILGNGGSSSIASHISQDYTKKLKKRSFTFSDSSRLTCYSNDYGYQNAYCQFLKEFCNQKTLVILISSSGNSDNILNCADWCEENKIKTITLTGFSSDNKLKNKPMANREVNYWVDSEDYGIVECVHQIFLHMVV
jgi:D-sedoheptulose 7-phosphate isomerase